MLATSIPRCRHVNASRSSLFPPCRSRLASGIGVQLADPLSRRDGLVGLELASHQRESIGWLREDMRFLNSWRMPLIFVVSGAAIMLALSTRSPGRFARRPGAPPALPLAFGMIVLVPPQDYVERLYRRQFSGSFLDWLPQAFAGAYPAGKLRLHHLWFLAYVLVLTFVLLPCFLWARSARGRADHARAASVVARAGLQWLMPLPLAAAMLWLAPISASNGSTAWSATGSGSSITACCCSTAPSCSARRRCWPRSTASAILSLAIGVGGLCRALCRLSSMGRSVRSSRRATVRPICAVVGSQHNGVAVRDHRLRQSLPDAAAGFPGRSHRSGLPVLHAASDRDSDRGLLAARDRRAAGRGIHPVAALATFLGTSAIYFWVVRPLWFMRPFFGLKAATLAGRGGPTELKRTGPRLSVSP